MSVCVCVCVCVCGTCRLDLVCVCVCACVCVYLTVDLTFRRVNVSVNMCISSMFRLHVLCARVYVRDESNSVRAINWLAS